VIFAQKAQVKLPSAMKLRWRAVLVGGKFNFTISASEIISLKLKVSISLLTQ